MGWLGSDSDEEDDELGPLIRDVSRALGSILGRSKTYVAQFAEHPLHPHVHVDVVPRHADHDEALVGPNVFDALGVPDDQRVGEATMNGIAADMNEQLRR